MQEVGPSIFFSLLVITVSFLPVFTLEGTEGRLFKPLAFTKTFSMGFAAMLAVTLTPALAALFIRGKIRDEDAQPVNRWLDRARTRRSCASSSRYRWHGASSLAAARRRAHGPGAASGSGSEFMPPLNEGVILYMPTAPPGMSRHEAARRAAGDGPRAQVSSPRSRACSARPGRAETPTDPAPLGMVETTVVLKPRDRVARRA